MSSDLISRQAALDALKRDEAYDEDIPNRADGVRDAIITIMGLPSAQPDLPEAYAKKVWTWLLDYQTTAAELKAKYSAYEVLSWVVNDWRRGHDGLN